MSEHALLAAGGSEPINLPDFQVMNNIAITPGQLYWLTTKSNIPHPHVVLSISAEEVLVASITTNMNKAHLPGNVRLNIGEGHLGQESIVEVTKVRNVPLSELTDLIGTLSAGRMAEIERGREFVRKAYFEHGDGLPKSNPSTIIPQ